MNDRIEVLSNRNGKQNMFYQLKVTEFGTQQKREDLTFWINKWIMMTKPNIKEIDIRSKMYESTDSW